MCNCPKALDTQNVICFDHPPDVPRVQRAQRVAINVATALWHPVPWFFSRVASIAQRLQVQWFKRQSRRSLQWFAVMNMQTLRDKLTAHRTLEASGQPHLAAGALPFVAAIERVAGIGHGIQMKLDRLQILGLLLVALGLFLAALDGSASFRSLFF